MTEIVVTSCRDCPFYEVYEGNNLCRAQKQITLTLMQLTANCPLKTNSIQITLKNDIENESNRQL